MDPADPALVLNMADYSAEIAALERALANDVTEVDYGDKRVKYASADEIMKRLNLLRGLSGRLRPGAGVVAFSRGE